MLNPQEECWCLLFRSGDGSDGSRINSNRNVAKEDDTISLYFFHLSHPIGNVYFFQKFASEYVWMSISQPNFDKLLSFWVVSCMSTSFELEPVWAYHAMETLLDSDMRWCVYQNEGMPRRIKRIEDGAFVDKTALMVELNYLDKHGNCTNYHGIWIGSGQYLASSFSRLLHLTCSMIYLIMAGHN